MVQTEENINRGLKELWMKKFSTVYTWMKKCCTCCSKCDDRMRSYHRRRRSMRDVLKKESADHNIFSPDSGKPGNEDSSDDDDSVFQKSTVIAEVYLEPSSDDNPNLRVTYTPKHGELKPSSPVIFDEKIELIDRQSKSGRDNKENSRGILNKLWR